VEAPAIALRLFLLAAQITDECGFEDLAYDLYVQAFTVYEESISESRAQLQAVALIIGTLQGAKVFGTDNFDTLITKAALHGAKLLKKPHQSMSVNVASHLWWQESLADDTGVGNATVDEKKEVEKEKEKEAESVKDPRAVGTDTSIMFPCSSSHEQYPHQDSKRVLECLQKSLRIANSATEEIVTVQLYCDTLDQYLYYLDRGAPAVSFFFISMVIS
jgi:vacuolar protein sorting-associated protein 35